MASPALFERVKVTRTPTSLTLSSAFERRNGIAIAVGGLGIIAVALIYGLTVLGIFALILGALITGLGIVFIGPHVIRVEPDLVSAGRLLLGSRRSQLPRTDLDKIKVGAVNSVRDATPTYYVAAESGSGSNALLFVTKSKELADHIARVIEDAIATSTTSSSTA